jgi:D-serine dehydratase
MGFDAAAMSGALDALEDTILTPEMKGVPRAGYGRPIRDVPAKRWNVLRGELPSPVAVVRLSELEHNAIWMNQLLRQFRLELAPHAKTTMAPHLFAHQAEHGCWGLTVATVQQAHVAARFGCRRLILANEVSGRAQIESAISLRQMYPDLRFYSFIDSVECLRLLVNALRDAGFSGVFDVLIDIGFSSGRTGCRRLEDVKAVLAELERSPTVSLAGIGGYEGLIAAANGREDAVGVDRYFDFFNEAARCADAQGAFHSGEIVLTAGGSSYYDVVGRRLREIELKRPCVRVLRSGCYVTHDCGIYAQHSADMSRRRPDLHRQLGELHPSLFVWTTVQSVPEPSLAILTGGKRDLGHDTLLPVPTWHHRPSATRSTPRRSPGGWRVTKLNDQHAYMAIAPDDDIRVDDLVALGISHPCTTFDRWRLIHVVDDNWTSVGVMPTFF